MAKHITVVLSECKRDEPDLESVERKIAAALENRPGVSVALLPHLYDLAVDGPGVEFLRKVDGDLIVAAPLYARTIYWLLDAAEVTGRRSRSSFDTDEETEAWSAERDDEVSDRTIWCLDVRPHRQTEEALLDEIERIVAGRDAVPPAAKDAVPPAARDA
ncbi:MAG: hypothetical protein HQ567_10905, partial [Candidatus Nealsonbacteria bacterium]|nr:hypothetical protein [Candidatus Nealsonbacteria bacterium]